MAKRSNDTGARGTPEGTLSHLITEQDVHAFVDGQLPPERRAAVARFLSERAMTAKQAAAYLRSTFDLRAVRDELYADEALGGEIRRLLAKRAAKADAPEGEPARRVFA